MEKEEAILECQADMRNLNKQINRLRQELKAKAQTLKELKEDARRVDKLYEEVQFSTLSLAATEKAYSLPLD